MASIRGKGSVGSNIFTEAALSHIGMAYGKASLETIQALLMVGYHRWYRLQNPLGISDMKLGFEYATAMGYQRNYDETTNAGHDQAKDQAIISESRRRTFWSCYVLDSYLSLMAQRPPSIRMHEVLIQLPRTEYAFLHGLNVETRLLRRDEGVYGRRKANTDKCNFEVAEEALSLFIQAVHLCRELMDVSRTQERRYLDSHNILS
jgi:hypothetical protein